MKIIIRGRFDKTKFARGLRLDRTDSPRPHFYFITEEMLHGINMSYGGWRFFNNATLQAMYTLTSASDILFVKAAGNDNNDLDVDGNGDGAPDNPEYPCNSPDRTANVICVAASNNRDTLATGAGSNAHSNFGATSVDLAAPGENIRSLFL